MQKIINPCPFPIIWRVNPHKQMQNMAQNSFVVHLALADCSLGLRKANNGSIVA